MGAASGELKSEVKTLKEKLADAMGKIAAFEAQLKSEAKMRDHIVEAAVKAAESEMQKKVSAAFQEGMSYAKTFILESRQMK